MRYDTLETIHDMLEGVAEAAAKEIESINAEIKKADPDMPLPLDHPLMKKLRVKEKLRMKVKEALEDFESADF